MQSKATTVEQYLADLSEDRREALSAVRKIILDNLDRDFEEGMQYGMIGYYVPHRVYPAGYHCDPKQPLCYAGLASQKNYMSLYLMCIYGDGPIKDWFCQEWAKSGKKLDMGKSCIRFKKLDDLALDVVANTFRRVTAKKYIAYCESALESRKSNTATKAKSTSTSGTSLSRPKTSASTKAAQAQSTTPTASAKTVSAKKELETSTGAKKAKVASKRTRK